MTPAAVLRDRRLDRRLRRDGFVRVRVLSAEAAARLRQTYGEVHGWTGDGFEVDFWNPDPAYRQQASDAIAAIVDAPLRDLFVDHEPFLRNFLVKWPGERPLDGFPEGPHRDWMYTDERAGERSCVAWIALQDVTGHNGQLQVARGSHRLDDRLRGTNISTPWLEDQPSWAPRMLAVPARAGEAIITDAATVHGSYSNLSEDPRLAVAVAIRRRGAQLVHYRNIDDHRAARFEVDPEFFLVQPAPDLLVAPPDLPVAGVEEIGGRDLTPVEVAGELDRQPLAVLDRLERTVRRAAER